MNSKRRTWADGVNFKANHQAYMPPASGPNCSVIEKFLLALTLIFWGEKIPSLGIKKANDYARKGHQSWVTDLIF